MLREKIKRQEMRVRGAAPQWVRTIYRATSAFRPMEISRRLPKELVQNCRVCASRLDMVDELPKNAVVAELGTLRGDFAREIVSRCTPRELHLIDIDYSRFDDSRLTDPSIRRHQGLSHEVVLTFPDDYFDWVYVDADHSYAGTMANARACANKVRPGGFLVFNDFAHVDPRLGRYGVHRAVTEFAAKEQWSLHFFALDGAALYDVALRKPRT